jgi:chromosome segregation ATPase
MARYIMAIGDCQHKTSNRVKSVKDTVEEVQEDISHIKEEIKPMKKSHNRYTAEREQRKGAMRAIRIIWGIVGVGASVGAFILGRVM